MSCYQERQAVPREATAMSSLLVFVLPALKYALMSFHDALLLDLL